MTVAWTKHRFSGGLLVLDTANTVVLRGDPARILRPLRGYVRDRALRRRGGRIPLTPSLVAGACRSKPAEARCAAGHRLAGSGRPAVPGGSRDRRNPDRVISVNFCGHARPVSTPATSVSALTACRSAIRRSRSASRQHLPSRRLSLLAGDAWKKVRICPNCSWLFVDRSRNSSRLWCDMSVCGNRHKAKRHYERRRGGREEAVHA